MIVDERESNKSYWTLILSNVEWRDENCPVILESTLHTRAYVILSRCAVFFASFSWNASFVHSNYKQSNVNTDDCHTVLCIVCRRLSIQLFGQY
jgi:hypothetical protein